VVPAAGLAVAGSVPTLPHFLDDERIEDAIDHSAAN
jgi:hypothetical protein